MEKYSYSVPKLQILNDTRIFYYKSQKLQRKHCQKRISHPQEPKTQTNQNNHRDMCKNEE